MASGNSLLTFEATAYTPPAAGYATPDLRNAQPVLDFDATLEESAYFASVLPRHYSNGGITCRVMWTATSAVAGAVRWAMRFERHDVGTDLDADSFAAVVAAAAATTPATSGMPAYTDIAFTHAQIDGLIAGEHFRLQLIRAASDGLDTMTGDAELWSIELRET